MIPTGDPATIALEATTEVAWEYSRGNISRERAVWHLSIVGRLFPHNDFPGTPVVRSGNPDHWSIRCFNMTLWDELQRTIEGTAAYRGMVIDQGHVNQATKGV